MANPYHLKILRQGVKTWNEWREENPHIIPQLGRARLQKSKLSNVNFSNAYLRNAFLNKAKLNNADLSNANFVRAYLTGANLSMAKLNNANLRRAYLNNVNLCRADLHNANLSKANLQNTDLRGVIFTTNAPIERAVDLTEADLRRAIFTPQGKVIGSGSFLDLGSCIGLETAMFSKPDFLSCYLEEAFRYAHLKNNYEAKKWPIFLNQVINNIKALCSLYVDKQPPKQLIKVVENITTELIKYLKNHPKALHQIRPRQFEELIAEILASYGWQIQLTPTIKDGGYDIFAISKDIKLGVESSWIIECKKYATKNKIGVDIVRALYGTKSNLKVANALLATTSYFTKGAKDFKTSRYDIELKDYPDILEWINQYRPNPNGKLYLKNNRLIVPGED